MDLFKHLFLPTQVTRLFFPEPQSTCGPQTTLECLLEPFHFISQEKSHNLGQQINLKSNLQRMRGRKSVLIACLLSLLCGSSNFDAKDSFGKSRMKVFIIRPLPHLFYSKVLLTQGVVLWSTNRPQSLCDLVWAVVEHSLLGEPRKRPLLV